VRRLKGSTDSVHYLERDEVNGLKLLHRQQQANGTKGAYVFINERGQPFGRMGIRRMIERAGEAAGLALPVHAHMLRHACGYKLANDGHDTRAIQAYLGHRNIQNTTRYTALAPQRFKEFFRD
jgi:type 1 fimbriae regulatory protein FimB/type 1 fimbriae regulatory protein FimE